MYFFGLPKIIIKKEQLSIDSARTQHMETTIYGKISLEKWQFIISFLDYHKLLSNGDFMQLGALSNYLVVSAVGKFYF